MVQRTAMPGPWRFWAKVKMAGPDDCWLWTACKTPHGYGKLGVKGKMFRAHRLAYQLLVGPIPDGLVLDHLCRNPPCVNPAHLEPVTITENLHRGNTARGERCNGKLTEAQVVEIRARCASRTETYKAIAADYGICISTAQDVANRRTWTWVN